MFICPHEIYKNFAIKFFIILFILCNILDFIFISGTTKSLHNHFMRLTTTIFIIIFVFASSLVSGVEFDNIDQKFNTTLSFKFRNEPLISICEQIYQATGYEIKVDDKWSDIPITANIENDSVISALNKILKSYNHSILIDEKQKLILILFISDRVSTNNTLYNSSVNNDELNSIDTYAEEYIKSLPIDDSKTIIADSMDI